jgi:hypothetical protein
MEGLPKAGRNVGAVGRLDKRRVFRLGCCSSRDVSAGCYVYFSLGAEFHFAPSTTSIRAKQLKI